MTIEITSNPHSFIVFLTLNMGISYALFARSGFGLGKLFAVLFIVAPLALTAYERHHIVDMGLGFIIGTLFAKGIIDVSRPFDWLTRPFQNLRWKMQQAKRERAEARAQTEANQTYENTREQEARRRQEQARREREQARQKKTQGNNKNQSHSGNSNQSHQQGSSNQNQGYEQFKQRYQEPPPKQKTELEKAFETLGVPSTATRDETKRAYRTMAKEFHSDSQAGASESVKKIADEKMKEINVAWDKIKKQKGWK